MTLPALTHHQIVRLVEPLARQGRLVDLAASDRAARRIAFRLRDVPADGAGTPACHESITLDCISDTYFHLLRTLTPGSGPAATVGATGREVGALLERVLAVPVSQLFSAGPGWRLARSYDTELPRGVALPRAAAGTTPLVLARAAMDAAGLRLELVLRLPGLRSVAADLKITPDAGLGAHDAPALPEDLLAVLGWDWARLVRDKQGWTSKLRLRGNVLRRSRTAERALDRVGAHLVHVLGAPPGRFHDEHRLARWGVVLRRGLPSLTAVSMVLGALLLARFGNPSEANAGLLMALHYAPIALLALSFSLQELPQFEIPPLPRRSRAPHWQGDSVLPLPTGQPAV